MPWTQKTPLQRLTVAGDSASLKLPDNAMDLPMPDLGSMLGGKSAAFGFGKSGAGGGFGKGIGSGGASGVTFKPLTMFGKDLKGKRLAVVLDISSSMLTHLEKVVKEADRVAAGSPIVCYFGCGLTKRAKGDSIKESLEPTSSPRFERYWRDVYGGSSPKGGAIPEKTIYDMLNRRRATYFSDQEGITYAWIALLSDQVRNADTVYWFSDFFDQVDEGQAAIVLENLQGRKQRLFIHASEHGPFVRKVENLLVLPTGGEAILPLSQ